MESPIGRPKAVGLIEKAMDDWGAALSSGVVGSSREMSVYNALLGAGYLTEEAQERDE